MILGVLDVVECVWVWVEDVGGDVREETRGGGGASTMMTFDYVVFEWCMDVRVD